MIRSTFLPRLDKIGSRLCMTSVQKSLSPCTRSFHTTQSQTLYYFDHLPGEKSEKVNKGLEHLLGPIREKNYRMGNLATNSGREIFDVCVVGGGIIGLATARELLNRYPGMKVCVLEKEPEVGQHQTGHNSGVIHAGIYYEPGTLMARTCVRGADMMYKYAEEHGLPVERCGKLIVASNKKEHDLVVKLYEQGVANGVKDLEIVYKDQIREMEPNVAAYSALHSPNTGIINFWLVAQSILREIIDSKRGDVKCSFEAKKFEKTSDGLVKITGSETIMNGPVLEVYAKNVITCGGFYSDRLAGKAGGNPKEHRVVTFRGQYYQVKADKKALVRRNIYPVPSGGGIPVGVHFTPTVDVRRGHQLIVGPGACFTTSREGYRFCDFNLYDVWDTFSNIQFWYFAFKNFGLSINELYCDLNKRAFIRRARKIIPELTNDMVELSFAGVMSQVFENGGMAAQDFIIERKAMDGLVLNVRNAPTPAATASLAIGELVVDAANEDFGFKDKYNI
ncbi:FAD dependent oxidoreductase [Halteromyces radiatus]|uniref:FAD dependent oxidoreductase n=1 Tax=Halteromyces radiatus TaxID=101107 RepID=UPI00221EED31|nr:FAD dependent oxidoreductase [Halteromyces radiatus]KAI8088714.1 FAD dependent oxidoreductase [Halteromyces radiatus]